MKQTSTGTTPSNFVFGDRPIHIHKLSDGELLCNSPYCEYLNAHPLDQEQQRPPWAHVTRINA